MTKSETVESLLSPSLRVSRPVAACSRCRGAKIKCDGKLPACTACEKVGKAESCSSANDDFARGKERSYVAALEGACERLQKRVAELRAAQDLDTLTDSSGNATALKHSRRGRHHKQEVSDVDDLVGDFGFLSVNATSRDFHGFPGTMSWAKLLLKMVTKKPLSSLDSQGLPPRYHATQLIQLYLDTVYMLLPFISETELLGSLSAVYQDAGRQAKPMDHWTIRMVLAIAWGSMAQSRRDPSHQRALEQVSLALQVAEDVLHPGSMTGLQAVLLLTQYSLLDAEHFRSWYLIGIASRVLVDLGLHQDPALDNKVSRDVLEIRRRIFHSLYCMDRHISMASFRAFSLTDDSTAVGLPGEQLSPLTSAQSRGKHEFQQGLFLRSVQPSILLCQIRRIQSHAYQELYQSSRQPWSNPSSGEAYIWSVLAAAQNWYGDLPCNMSRQHMDFFEIEYLYTQSFILSPSIRMPHIPDLHKGLLFEKSINFAEKLHSVVQNSDWRLFLTSSVIERMNNVGKAFLDILWSDDNKVLSGKISQSTPTSPDASAPRPPPYSPVTDMASNVSRALHFFDITIEVLGYARQLWGIGRFRAEYEQKAAPIIKKLRLKHSELQERRTDSQPRQPVSSRLPASYHQSALPLPPLSQESDEVLSWQNTAYPVPATMMGQSQALESYSDQALQPQTSSAFGPRLPPQYYQHHDQRYTQNYPYSSGRHPDT